MKGVLQKKSIIYNGYERLTVLNIFYFMNTPTEIKGVTREISGKHIRWVWSRLGKEVQHPFDANSKSKHVFSKDEKK